MTSTPTSRRGCAGRRTIGSWTDLSRLMALRKNGSRRHGCCGTRPSNDGPPRCFALLLVDGLRRRTRDPDVLTPARICPRDRCPRESAGVPTAVGCPVDAAGCDSIHLVPGVHGTSGATWAPGPRLGLLGRRVAIMTRRAGLLHGLLTGGPWGDTILSASGGIYEARVGHGYQLLRLTLERKGLIIRQLCSNAGKIS